MWTVLADRSVGTRPSSVPVVDRWAIGACAASMGRPRPVTEARSLPAASRAAVSVLAASMAVAPAVAAFSAAKGQWAEHGRPVAALALRTDRKVSPTSKINEYRDGTERTASIAGTAATSFGGRNVPVAPRQMVRLDLLMGADAHGNPPRGRPV